MRLWVNGEQRAAPDGASVAEVLAGLGAPEHGVAVALDGEVVPRREWAGRVLSDGARLEVLTAVQGG